ncbi:MAG TPA: hypothetical protein VFD48_11045 [Pyrinomonadaceae bacterium]|nr:hypothetical protein [Pyrinomonadaceae bacterium]
MKAKAFVAAFVLCLVSATVCVAQSAQIGTWKLNEAKSKIPAGANKNHTVVYEAAGDSIKVIVDGTDAAGNAVHNEWTGKFDGTDYAVTGDPTSDTRAYRKIGARTLAMTIKKDGKVTITGRIIVTANGKTRTVTTSGTDAQGKKFRTVAVYDKHSM